MNKKHKSLLIQITAATLVLILAASFFKSEPFLSKVLCIISFFIAGYKIFFKTLKNFLNLKYNIFDENLLMCSAACGALILQEFFESVIIILFYQIGEFFQSLAVYNSKQSIKNLINLKPSFANLKTPDGLKKIKPEQIKINDIILVKPGEKIPIDGIVISGNSTLDTASMTGEITPKFVKPGDSVISGCINLSEKIEIKVETLYHNCTVQKILNLIENQPTNKSKTEKFITKFAKIYTPIIVITALILATVPTIIFAQNWHIWLNKAIILIAISCPCALVLSIPLSFFGGISVAAKNLILIKGSNFVETLSKAQTITFDKTGTLTLGKFKITSINPINTTKEELITILVNAESFINHPIAKAITKEYKNKLNTKEILRAKEFPGLGIKITAKNETTLAGNSKLMDKFNIKYEKNNSSATVIYIAKNGKYYGNVTLADKVKPEAAKTIKFLRKLKIKNLIMLTGDEEKNANHISKNLNLDAHFSKLLPHEKLQKIQQLQKQSEVVFIGDGINDAPALYSADVGVAMGKNGSDAAIEAADVVLMSNNLEKIAQTILISKNTMKIVRQNIIISIAIKLIILVIGTFCSPINAAIAIFSDALTSILAVLNALRTLKV